MLLFCANSVGAYNIGDVINCAQPTSIVASINGYQLMSYNVDGFEEKLTKCRNEHEKLAVDIRTYL